MIPYGDFQFFYLSLLILSPVIILGLFGRKNIHLNFAVTLIMIAIIFSDQNKNIFNIPVLSFEIISLIIFIIYQIIIIKSYIHIVQKKNTLSIFSIMLLLSILPLIIVKVIQSSIFGFGSIHIDQLSIKAIIGFLGISYIMFKCIQILMEIRDRRIKAISMYDLLRFLLFFPTISSGPIDRFKRFQKDEQKNPGREIYMEKLAKAVHYIFLGFFYKYIVAYLINTYIILNIDFEHTRKLFKLAYMYAYSLYLFFDFAGYSLFAIAFSLLLWIETPANFKQPFKAVNIQDFWNRWHMSLSFWFRDMVYMRFVYFMYKKKWIKNQQMISSTGFMLNFLIMGIWHGIEWFYIAYGLYHGSMFVLYQAYVSWKKKNDIHIPEYIARPAGIFITFHAVAFGFLIFSGKLF